MNIILQGTRLDLTDDLRDFVNRKINDCLPAFGDMDLAPVQIAIELELTTRRHTGEKTDEQLYRAEALVSMPGNTIRVEESAMNIEQAIVKLKHTLTRDIRKWRERLIDERRRGGRKAKAIGMENETQVSTESNAESWVEEWMKEEERLKAEKERAEDKKWEDWQEESDDQRDYI